MSFNWLLRCCQRGRASIIILFCFLIPSTLFAQEVMVQGGFLSDSLKIGEQTAYYLSAHYPSNLTVLFPDSTSSFSSFEYQRKEYFSTKTTDGISADSTLYYLTTFEVDRVQYLDLPVYIVNAQDCTLVRTSADSVLITQFVQQVPDTLSADKLPLKMNTAYQKVFMNFNFWLMVIIIFVLLTLAVLGWLIFGKNIRMYFKARRLQKDHLQFLQNYNSFLGQLQAAFSGPVTESALSVWKKYMEQLESRPYTKLTTRETLNLVKEPALTEHLSQVDKAIYGHDTAVMESLESLKSFAVRQFSRRMKEVKHG